MTIDLNVGAVANDHTGTNRRVAWQRVIDKVATLDSLQSQIISAGDAQFASLPTSEARIEAACVQAELELKDVVFVPATMSPHDPTLIGAHPTIRRVREGGDFSAYDVQAYGADALGVIDAGPSWNACRAAIPASGGPMRVPFGTYNFMTAFTFASHSNVTVTIDAGVTLIGAQAPLTKNYINNNNNTFIDYRSGLVLTGPNSRLLVVGIDFAGPPTVQFSRNGGGSQQVLELGYAGDDTLGPDLELDKARGSYPSNATAVLSNDILGQISFGGFDGTTVNHGANIKVNAAENFTATKHGASMAFWTTTVGQNTPAQRWIISSSGHWVTGGDGSNLDIGFVSSNRPRTIHIQTSFNIGGVQILSGRKTGWAAWTGTAARGTQNADAPPTLTQVAQTLKALLDDLISHGLIGT